MDYNQLFANIRKKESFLCVGLDTDINKIPKFLLKTDDPVFEFNKKIINATADFCIAYKPNIAFYEALGSIGWISLEKTVNYIKKNYPDVFLIADAKRGDIGNTSGFYAKAFFDNLGFDAITLSPYMGKDSITPFIEYPDKWAIILALTSNKSAEDFQFLKLDENNKKHLFEQVLLKSQAWGNKSNLMFVVGATKASMIKKIREIIPDYFILVPGIGAQGGDLESVVGNGINDFCGLIINSSRSVLYADSTDKFENAARKVADNLKKKMSFLLKKYNLI